MVFTMESDGSLSPSNSQDTFARNYTDRVGQGEHVAAASRDEDAEASGRTDHRANLRARTPATTPMSVNVASKDDPP